MTHSPFWAGMLRMIVLNGDAHKTICALVPWTGVDSLILRRQAHCLFRLLCVWSGRYYLAMNVKLFKPVAVIQGTTDLPRDFMYRFFCTGTLTDHCFLRRSHDFPGPVFVLKEADFPLMPSGRGVCALFDFFLLLQKNQVWNYFVCFLFLLICYLARMNVSHYSARKMLHQS